MTGLTNAQGVGTQYSFFIKVQQQTQGTGTSPHFASMRSPKSTQVINSKVSKDLTGTLQHRLNIYAVQV